MGAGEEQAAKGATPPPKVKDFWDKLDVAGKVLSAGVLGVMALVIKYGADNIANSLDKGDFVRNMIVDLASPSEKVKQDIALIALDHALPKREDDRVVADIAERLLLTLPDNEERRETVVYKILVRRDKALAERYFKKADALLQQTRYGKAGSASWPEIKPDSSKVTDWAHLMGKVQGHPPTPAVDSASPKKDDSLWTAYAGKGESVKAGKDGSLWTAFSGKGESVKAGPGIPAVDVVPPKGGWAGAPMVQPSPSPSPSPAPQPKARPATPQAPQPPPVVSPPLPPFLPTFVGGVFPYVAYIQYRDERMKGVASQIKKAIEEAKEENIKAPEIEPVNRNYENMVRYFRGEDREMAAKVANLANAVVQREYPGVQFALRDAGDPKLKITRGLIEVWINLDRHERGGGGSPGPP